MLCCEFICTNFPKKDCSIFLNVMLQASSTLPYFFFRVLFKH